MKCDIIDNNGYVTTLDTVKLANALVKQVKAGCKISVYVNETKTDRIVELPIVIRPAAKYIDRPEGVSLTGQVDKKVTKRAEQSQPILKLDGKTLISEEAL